MRAKPVPMEEQYKLVLECRQSGLVDAAPGKPVQHTLVRHIACDEMRLAERLPGMLLFFPCAAETTAPAAVMAEPHAFLLIHGQALLVLLRPVGGAMRALCPRFPRADADAVIGKAFPVLHRPPPSLSASGTPVVTGFAFRAPMFALLSASLSSAIFPRANPWPCRNPRTPQDRSRSAVRGSSPRLPPRSGE